MIVYRKNDFTPNKYGRFFLAQEAHGDEENVFPRNRRVVTVKPSRTRLDFPDEVEDWVPEDLEDDNTNPIDTLNTDSNPIDDNSIDNNETNPIDTPEENNNTTENGNPIDNATDTNPVDNNTDTNPVDNTNPIDSAGDNPADANNPVDSNQDASPNPIDNAGGDNPADANAGNDAANAVDNNDEANPAVEEPNVIDNSGSNPPVDNPVTPDNLDNPTNPEVITPNTGDDSQGDNDLDANTDYGNDSGDVPQNDQEQQPQGPGVDFEAMRSYNTLKEYTRLLHSIDSYIEKLENVSLDDSDQNKVIRVSIEKLKEIRDLVYDYILMKYEVASYIQNHVFLQKQIISIQLIFNMIEKFIPAFSDDSKERKKKPKRKRSSTKKPDLKIDEEEKEFDSTTTNPIDHF